MRISTGYETRKARIELLPMIDVVFLLLVFFIYAMLSMVVHRGIRVALPTGTTTQVHRDRFISIGIDRENRLFLDRQEISLKALPDALAAARKKSDPPPPIFITGDATADLGFALKVLDRLRHHGFSDVSFEMTEANP